MNLKSFLKLVEIQTKVASITPFLLGSVFTLYYYNTFNIKNFFLMLISLLCIDMATTTINNYMDYKKANKKEGYGYESHNAIVRDNLKETTVLFTIFILLSIATAFGFLLYLNTNIVVLLLGTISFMIGISYTFGPVPISRTPFGEAYSGGFMGLIIPFIAIYIHIYDMNIIDLIYSTGNLKINLNVREIAKILLISIPLGVGIANIMLANNICDIDDDIENKRYTLPIYIGKKYALIVFRHLYTIGYLAIITAIIFRVLPLISLLSLLTFIIVNKNINTFSKIQSKQDTFILSVKNFILMNMVLLITIALGLINL